MATEPSSVQRDRMLAHGKSKLTLVQFLAADNPEAIDNYLAETQRAVQTEGGSRGHQLKIDQVLTRGEMPYHYLIVDNFPSSQALLLAHENTRAVRLSNIREEYAILVRPNPLIKRIAKGLGFLAPALIKLLKTAEVRDLGDFTDQVDPETDPVPEAVKIFSSEDLDQPFFMMNLNQFSPSKKRGVNRKSAYNQYALQILPYLVSVGGYPEIYGENLGSFIGDQRDPLFNSWHDFALVYYPSRTSFLRLMTNTPRSAAAIRREGLKQVVLMAGSETRS
jgi:hypothetical protein